MEMTEHQRRTLAAMLIDVRTQRFAGNRKAAYTAAGVNAETWRRAEGGETLKERSVVQILSRLVPRTGGDWRNLFDEDGAVTVTAEELTGSSSDTPDAERLDIAFEILSGVSERLAAIEARMNALETGSDSRQAGLSAVPDTVADAVAAHEEEGSIAGEQEESDTP